MGPILVYLSVVLISGWGLGHLLARQSQKSGALISPLAAALSLLTVAIPTVLAFVLSDSAQRSSLFSQFLPRWDLAGLLASVLLPLSVAIVGHLSGNIASASRMTRVPSGENVRRGLGFLPLALLWGLLEEIGWRGFLFEG